jgi:hypothetical protein
VRCRTDQTCRVRESALSLGRHCQGNDQGGVSFCPVEDLLFDGSLFPLTTVRGNAMSLGTILLIVLILILIGAIPRWPHSQSWGYAPTGGIGLLILIVVVLLLLGKL